MARLTREKVLESRIQYYSSIGYHMLEWSEFDFKILNKILYRRRAGRGTDRTFNDVIIMGDTETSKKANESGENHVVAWTISIRAFDMNIVTLYGRKPSEFVRCVQLIHKNMEGDDTFIYFHNFAYDYIFLRKFLFENMGYPIEQLNTKSHYPIMLKFQNGVIFKDSLILAQRKLERWAYDLQVEHRKAVGCWDYDKLRNQTDEPFTEEELKYIENDTLAGVECIDATMKSLNKSIYSIPYTATGIPREALRKEGKKHNAKDIYNRKVLTFEQYKKAENCFHGGYTHANRHLVECTIKFPVKPKDFSSSYPYTLLGFKFQAEAYYKRDDCTMDYIVLMHEDYSYMFTFVAYNVELINPMDPMPPLQYSKTKKIVNPVLDNGRVLRCDYVEINLLEWDAAVIFEKMKWDGKDSDICECVDVYVARKEYLPRFMTDFIYEAYKTKTELKGANDPVMYSIKKSTVNSIYGMFATKNIRPDLQEVFATGDYLERDINEEEVYQKYIENYNNILNYQIGCMVTSIAFYNLFQLAKCCEVFVYSDTDSVYGINWDEEAVERYNEGCKKRLLDNGYGPVEHNGREYWLGIAEEEEWYTEFRVLGAKRYCGRRNDDGQLHITVAGVPKAGAKCLKDDINNFTKGFIFPGSETGKLLHTYHYVEDIYIDEWGNETGDSIDLSPCDYLLDSVKSFDFDSIFFEEVNIQVYE